jgi:hypothetical protein
MRIWCIKIGIVLVLLYDITSSACFLSVVTTADKYQGHLTHRHLESLG